jgi:hypothetical protein
MSLNPSTSKSFAASLAGIATKARRGPHGRVSGLLRLNTAPADQHC